MKKVLLSLILSITFLVQLNGQSRNELFVDQLTGVDTSSGTIENPLKTIQAAVNKLGESGGTVFLREGTYLITSNIKPLYSGNKNEYNNLFAYGDEKPIIDCSLLTGSSNGIQLNCNYWHIKGLEVKNAPHNGINIAGSHNIVENCQIHNNQNTGLHIAQSGNYPLPSYNYILNCDSYFNYDPDKNGENADGFGIKYEIGPGNEFRGCRAYNNSDDGWDLWMAGSTVTIDSCLAFRNGINLWNDPDWQGDGNGIKLGGNYVAASHIVFNCVSFDNFSTGRGFDENNNMAGQTLYNCTAFRNKGDNYHFTNNIAPLKHIIKNCISFEGIINLSNIIQENNSWQGFSVTASDFISLDTSLATAPRNKNGSLPDNGFFRLSSGSSLIDAGTDVGIPYSGIAPDIGAHEVFAASGIMENDSHIPEKFRLDQNYPNPFNPSTVIGFSLPESSDVTLTVIDNLGREVMRILNRKHLTPGSYRVKINFGSFSSGVYFYRISAGQLNETKKMIVLK